MEVFYRQIILGIEGCIRTIPSLLLLCIPSNHLFNTVRNLGNESQGKNSITFILKSQNSYLPLSSSLLTFCFKAKIIFSAAFSSGLYGGIVTILILFATKNSFINFDL